MKRLLAVPILVVGALALGAFAFADPGHGNKQPHPNKARVLIHTTDGSCSGGGAVWADDTIMRTLKVHKNRDGSYRIREYDRGSFVTNAGGLVASPGNCPANTSRHGHTVLVGVTGTLKGYIKGIVTGGTFDPHATCSTSPCKQGDFIKAFFGTTASFSCLSDSPKCKFKYGYHAKEDQNLLFRYWLDRGKGGGTFLKEHFFGDIASA
jgi:hypothetical protein